MFSPTPRATFAVLLALAALTGALVASPAAATQQTPENNTTTTTPTTTPEDDTRNVSIPVDQNTHVAAYEYVGGEFRVTLVTSAPVTRVTVSEAIGGDVGGTGYFSVRQVTLIRGEPTTVTIPAEQVDGKAVITLTTSACIQSGKCPYIQAGSGSSHFFDGSAQWRYVYIAGFVSMGGVAYGTRRYMKKQAVEDDERQVREVPEP
jgi:hypothetical protein